MRWEWHLSRPNDDGIEWWERWRKLIQSVSTDDDRNMKQNWRMNVHKMSSDQRKFEKDENITTRWVFSLEQNHNPYHSWDLRWKWFEFATSGSSYSPSVEFLFQSFSTFNSSKIISNNLHQQLGKIDFFIKNLKYWCIRCWSGLWLRFFVNLAMLQQIIRLHKSFWISFASHRSVVLGTYTRECDWIWRRKKKGIQWNMGKVNWTDDKGEAAHDWKGKEILKKEKDSMGGKTRISIKFESSCCEKCEEASERVGRFVKNKQNIKLFFTPTTHRWKVRKEAKKFKRNENQQRFTSCGEAAERRWRRTARRRKMVMNSQISLEHFPSNKSHSL